MQIMSMVVVKLSNLVSNGQLALETLEKKFRPFSHGGQTIGMFDRY